jgi:phosphoribosylglycinamide formyltransferase-1
MKNIAIMASGSGTNAENIIRFFRTNPEINVRLVLTNKADAYVLNRAHSFNIETVVFNRAQFYESDEIVNILLEKEIDLVVLAGFLWLIPESLVKAFDGSIVNIHPALLPNYGGKGMYGKRVHQSVIENNESESGITIHLVNEKYDDGDIIFQERCKIEPGETPESLADKVHDLEYKYFPIVIEKLLK